MTRLQIWLLVCLSAIIAHYLFKIPYEQSSGGVYWAGIALLMQRLFGSKM